MTVHAFDQGHLLAVIRQNPQRPREGALQYMQRVCVLAGLIRPEDTSGEPVGGWHNAGDVVEADAEGAEKEPYWNR